jgi:hypothetical protein
VSLVLVGSLIEARNITQERNGPFTQPSRQPSAGGATDVQTPKTLPAACDRSALTFDFDFDLVPQPTFGQQAQTAFSDFRWFHLKRTESH